MKIKRKTQPSSLMVEINLSVPKSWEEMTDKQLRFVHRLRLKGYDDARLKLQCLLRFNRVTVVKPYGFGWMCSLYRGFLRRKLFYIRDWELQSFIHHLDYLSDPGSSVGRLTKIGKYVAINAQLRDLEFRDYLICENLYQGYLFTKQTEYLRKLAAVLYRNNRGEVAARIKLAPIEEQTILQWYYAVKQLFATKFDYFFQCVHPDESEVAEETEAPDMESLMNAQIRALTGGDITKEEVIFKMDTWRALTELNEKAREAQELEQLHKKK